MYFPIDVARHKNRATMSFRILLGRESFQIDLSTISFPYQHKSLIRMLAMSSTYDNTKEFY